MGVRTVSIEDKVRKEAEKRGVDDPEDYFLVKPEDFRLMHKTIQSMRLCESAAVGDKGKESKEGDFVAILWQWQVLLIPHRREAAQTLNNPGTIWYERQTYDKALAMG